MKETNILKALLILFLLISFTYAQFQTVRIGTIDKQYHDALSKEQLRQTIDEIEKLFESQLGFNVFDYSPNGIPIDVIYMPPSKKKKRVLQNQAKSQSLKEKMQELSLYIDTKNKSIESSRANLNDEYEKLNKSIEGFNQYVESLKGNVVSLPSSEDISNERELIKKNTASLKKRKKQFNREVSRLKQKIRQYNLLVGKYNRLQRDSEKLSKTIVEVKGVTKAKTHNIYTSYTENEKTVLEKTTNTFMEKIEIYNFENIELLKVVLAHELGHLVGVEHIDAVDALMNPLVQKSQLDNLSLTYDDIEAFHKAFQ